MKVKSERQKYFLEVVYLRSNAKVKEKDGGVYSIKWVGGGGVINLNSC